jgi:uncharacterized membrane protein YqaE (UPF0057 family)
MLSILAVLCPPLAVWATGKPSRVLANLGLTLLGFLPGVLHALAEVERHTVGRRYESVMRALERQRAA